MRFALLLLIIAFWGPSVMAQDKIPDAPLQIKFWAGYSYESVYFLGKTRNATSSIFGIGFIKPIRSYQKGGVLHITGDFIPYVSFDYPKRDQNDEMVVRSGFGISPIGFMFDQPLNKYISFQAGISGSFIYMEDKFPTDKGRKLNYTFDPSFSLTIKIANQLKLSTGYKFHHISNAQTGEENPGLDSNFLFISITIQ